MPTKPSGRSPSQSRTAFQHLREQLKYVDIVFEVVDARVPQSSRHPRSKEIFGNKPRLLVLTKEDLADRRKLEQWLDLLSKTAKADEASALALSLKLQKNKERIFHLSLEMTQTKRQQQMEKGLLARPIRACVVGMPNVGKSSLINWLIGRKRAKVGNKPGVTKGPQWVRVHPQIELLDTPGILPAFSFSQEAAEKLALMNLLPEANYDMQTIAEFGLALMKQLYPELLAEYMPDCILDELSLDDIALRKHFLTSGGKPDTVRAASRFVTDLRDGNLGRVTLETPRAHL